MSEIDDIETSVDEELQQRFTVALDSLAPSPPPDPIVFHERLRKRRFRTRAAGLAGLIVVVSVVVTVNVGGSNDPASAAVTLYARDDAALSQGELSADAKLMRDRLNAIGDHDARVRITGGAIVVTGGPTELTRPGSLLTESPSLLVRSLLCQSGPFDGSGASPLQALPISCAGTPYAVQPDAPEPSSPGSPLEYSVPSVQPDPALAAFPATTPGADAANPSASALLPIAGDNKVRDLVGPAQLTLSSKVATARVVQNGAGTWLVDVSLSVHEATLFDQVAYKNFHLQLAVDLDGEIVSSPIIEPTRSRYTSLDGRLELSGPSRAWAEDIAAALQSGPLPIALRLAHAA